ncbi:MAG: hypothetical protein EOP06_25535, partial [Proteobacteria bacterium]
VPIDALFNPTIPIRPLDITENKVDLGGRGIRDIAMLADGRMILLAGPAQLQPISYALFQFDPRTSAVSLLAELDSLAPGAKAEALQVLKNDGKRLDAIIMFDGVNGVEPQSETVWRQADKHKVPRICFINKMDRVGADFVMSLESIKEKLGANPIAVQVPVGIEDTFKGVVDLLENKAYLWDTGSKDETFRTAEVPDDMKAEVAKYRIEVIEKIVEFDDTLMDKYLNGEEISVEELKKALRKGTLSLKAVPTFCGAAFKNKGVQPMLDGVIDYLPSPLDVPAIEGHDPAKPEKTIICKTDFEAHTAALAFKISNDPFAGTLTYIRVYSGEVKIGDQLLNPRTEKKERIQKLVKLHANSREEIQSLKAGDIGAVVGLKFTGTGDTLCESSHPVVLE